MNFTYGKVVWCRTIIADTSYHLFYWNFLRNTMLCQKDLQHHSTIEATCFMTHRATYCVRDGVNASFYTLCRIWQRHLKYTVYWLVRMSHYKELCIMCYILCKCTYMHAYIHNNVNNKYKRERERETERERDLRLSID